jgi:hypothetical protein
MEPNFLGEGCHVFMNESEIRIEIRTKCERSKEIINYQSKNNDTIQLIIQKLHE